MPRDPLIDASNRIMDYWERPPKAQADCSDDCIHFLLEEDELVFDYRVASPREKVNRLKDPIAHARRRSTTAGPGE